VAVHQRNTRAPLPGASPRDVYNFEAEVFHTHFVACAGAWEAPCYW